MKQTVTPDQELSENEKKTRDLILTLPLFDVFKTDELDILARHMHFAEILRSEHLFVEEDKGDFMCFVVRGLLDVLKKTTAGDYRVITRLGKGNTIGEMSIIDRSPRSASVVARQPSGDYRSRTGGSIDNRHLANSVALAKPCDNTVIAGGCFFEDIKKASHYKAHEITFIFLNEEMFASQYLGEMHMAGKDIKLIGFK